MKKTKKAAKKTPKPKTKDAARAEHTGRVVLPGVDGAFGLTRVKGLGANAEADALLGLGYPHCFVVVDEPFVAPKDFAAFNKRYQHTMRMPREAIGRAYAVRTAGNDMRKVNAAAVADAKPVTLAREVPRMLEHGSAHHLWLLEAMFGSDVVADAVVAALEALPDNAWRGGKKLENYGGVVIRALFATLLRVTPAHREKLRARLRTILERERARGTLWRPAQALDVILHGRVGVERSGRRFQNELNLSELAFVDDDHAWLASTLSARLASLRPAEGAIFDAQLAVAGGAAALEILLGAKEKFSRAFRAFMNDQLTLFATR